MREQHLLSKHAAGRVDRGAKACLLPLEKANRHVSEHLALKFAMLKAPFPDQSLQSFEGCCLSVVVHKPQQVLGGFSNQILARYRGCAGRNVSAVGTP